MFTAEWLMGQTFPPLRYVIPGIIPEGFTILAAAPKTGKSWLCLDLAYQLAAGGNALGKIPVVESRPVLYLALEDGPRRLQNRLQMLGATHGPADLHFAVDVAKGGIQETVEKWMERYPDRAPVVILDTLGKVSPAASAGESDYQRDYRIGGALKALADGITGGAVIAVHHTRKALGEDFLDSVSGTQGLAGSADSILVLRRSRNETVGSLSVTSRDAAEGEYAVEMIDNTWTLLGTDLQQAAQMHQQQKATVNLGEDSTRIVDYVNRHPEGVRAADVARDLGIDQEKAKRYLLRAADSERIQRADRGLYCPVTIAVPTVPSVPLPNGEWDTRDGWDTGHGEG